MDRPPPAPPDHILELAERGRAYVERAVGMPVGYDEVALAAIDHYLGTARAVTPGPEPKREPIFALVVSTVGALFGELVRRNLGGLWTRVAGDPEGWRMAVGALELSPSGLAAEALHAGPAEGFEGGITAPLGLQQRLEALLAAGAPVTEEYFYSLTGRYETLARMLELVAGLEAEARGPEPDEAAD